jgi:hypothetical protein
VDAKSTLKPWGYHPGITLFVAVDPESDAPVDGDTCA